MVDDRPSRQSGVHFRKPTEPPTKSGLYYARFLGASKIDVVEVEEFMGTIYVHIMNVQENWLTGSLTWFGPVAEVVEG